MSQQKVKTPAKKVLTKGPKLEEAILSTMREISEAVGVTLGPGGCPILTERPEYGLPSSITKDGITVFRSLGYDDPVKHCIMEAARDAATRTASEAGDGTTSSAVLAESIVRRIYAYCKANPRVSPQKIVRRLEFIFKDTIEPTIRSLSRKVDFSTTEGKEILKSVAKISANGDEDLATAVMECFDIAGDHGNVTITEQSGPSSYEVEAVNGYPIGIGYEESCAKFYQKFLNDPGSQRVFLEKPIFLVYHGVINTVQTLLPLMQAIGSNWALFNEAESDKDLHNVVVIAAGFSETVLGTLAANFAMSDTINVFPLVAPKSPQINGQLYFLQDICAIANAKLFDPINRPLETARLEDLGPGLDSFECQRFRSTILGYADESVLVDKISEVEQLLRNPESELDKILLEERMAKLSGGIARLKVIGASTGELKEKRDRAEDAVCAVRGAIKYGCLPGGGWTLLKIGKVLPEIYLDDPIILNILGPALIEPFIRIMSNCGLKGPEINEALAPILNGIDAGLQTVYDASEHCHCDAFQEGILDSTPAVLESIRNSLSIAALLGTLGGVVVYKRDDAFERQDHLDTQEYLRNAGVNERDQRQ